MVRKISAERKSFPGVEFLLERGELLSCQFQAWAAEHEMQRRGRVVYRGNIRWVVVGSPSYFAQMSPPKTPQDLTVHNCINIRLPTYGGLFPWEFEKNGRELKVRVEGQLVFNTLALRLDAALAGLGLAYLPEDQVEAHLAEGRLVRVLADWCPPSSGYHLYYPSRRHFSPAFAVLVNALRYHR